MNTEAYAAEWLNFADMDLQTALYLLNMRPMPLEIICYHCQQSAEKYLKGFIATNNGSIVKTHDLVYLNRLCKEYDASFDEIDDLCIQLTDYGVQVRYPAQMDINEADVHQAIENAKSIQLFVQSKIKTIEQ